MHRRLWPILPLLLAASCAPSREPAPAPPAAPDERAAGEPPVRPRAEAERPAGFCPTLARVIEAEARGFAELRGSPAGGRLFAARLSLPGFSGCTIENDDYPGAIYACTRSAAGAADGRLPEESFARLAQAIDGCLAAPFWYPLRWRRGELFVHARGERQLNWRQEGSFPTPLLTLKLEEDLAGAGWYLRLAVQTLH